MCFKLFIQRFEFQNDYWKMKVSAAAEGARVKRGELQNGTTIESIVMANRRMGKSQITKNEHSNNRKQREQLKYAQMA